MKTATLVGAWVVAVVGTAQVQAETLHGLTFDNRIVSFDSMNPEMIMSSHAIAGLADGEVLLGLDRRPATTTLHTLAASGTLYELVPAGGSYMATSRGVLTAALAGSAFGIDFNPVPDRLRVVSNTGQNLRINPGTAATIVDGAVNADVSPVAITAVAYTNSFAGAMSTTLYAVDTEGDRLLRSTNPNAGIYVSTNLAGVAFQPLGLSFTTSNALGFDISPLTGVGYINIDSLLWKVDLTTGVGTSIGVIGAGAVRGIATGAVPEPATWALFILGFGSVGMMARRRRTNKVGGSLVVSV